MLNRLIFSLIFGASMVLASGVLPTPILESGEVRLKKPLTYTMKDFHLAWDIHYFEVLEYDVSYSRAQKGYVADSQRAFKVIFQSLSRTVTPREEKSRRWLMEAIIKPAYFWKQTLHPFPVERFRVLILLDASGRFKALESRKELLEMLGKIDTEAELTLWLATFMSDFSHPDSYKRVGDLFRVRYQDFFFMRCDYQERFVYFDIQGNQVKEEIIKKRHETSCVPINL